MLLLLRYVSANNSSHPQGYLRIVEVKELAGIYILPEDVDYVGEAIARIITKMMCN
jgi:hypothetical protein